MEEKITKPAISNGVKNSLSEEIKLLQSAKNILVLPEHKVSVFYKTHYFKNLTVFFMAVLFLFLPQIISAPTRSSSASASNIKSAEIRNYKEPMPEVIKPTQVNSEKTSKQSSQKIQLNNYLPILMYHHVGPITDPKNSLLFDLTVSAGDFEDQVKYFSERGYQTVSLKNAYEYIETNQKIPGNLVVFTFDDGYEDVFLYAVPVLKKYGFIGSFAIATDLLGRPGYAVWDQVIEAQKNGMEIISHTKNHLDLTSLKYSESDLTREIIESKTMLEQKLGVSVDFFVYPYGKYNYHTKELLKSAGYKMAFTTKFGIIINPKNLLETPRVRVHGQNGLEKLKKILER